MHEPEPTMQRVAFELEKQHAPALMDVVRDFMKARDLGDFAISVSDIQPESPREAIEETPPAYNPELVEWLPTQDRNLDGTLRQAAVITISKLKEFANTQQAGKTIPQRAFNVVMYNFTREELERYLHQPTYEKGRGFMADAFDELIKRLIADRHNIRHISDTTLRFLGNVQQNLVLPEETPKA